MIEARKRREYKTYLKEGSVDMSRVWNEVTERIKRGEGPLERGNK